MIIQAPRRSNGVALPSENTFGNGFVDFARACCKEPPHVPSRSQQTPFMPGRNEEPSSDSTTCVILQVEPALMLLHDRLDDGQPHTKAIFLGGVKRLAGLLLRAIRDATTVIDNRELNPS